MRKLLRTGLVPAGAWRGQAVGMAPAERLKLKRQMAAAAGKKEPVSLSLFMDVNNLEVEEELSTMATLAQAEGSWMGRWARVQEKGWRKHLFEVQTRRQVRGPAGAAMCETPKFGASGGHAKENRHRWTRKFIGKQWNGGDKLSVEVVKIPGWKRILSCANILMKLKKGREESLASQSAAAEKKSSDSCGFRRDARLCLRISRG